MDEKLEDALWSGLRAIEESIELRTRMMAQARERRLTAFTAALDAEIDELTRRADALRQLLVRSNTPETPAQPRTAHRRKRQAHG